MGNTTEPGTAEIVSEKFYDTFISDNDDEGRVCRDIPDEACNDQPLAFTSQLAAQTLTKFADALVSPRLVIAWMLSSLGAPAFFISLLVPVRESMSLVPQLFIAKFLRERPLRKTFWALGAAGQAAALGGMIPAVLMLEGSSLGAAVIGLLVMFSLCRGVCSVASKDVLGKTVSKSRRGRLSGMAASLSGVAILSVAGFLVLQNTLGLSIEGSPAVFSLMLALAVLMWITSLFIFLQIPEVEGATEGGGSAIREALDNISLLIRDQKLRDFVITRAMLISVGIAIPFIVTLLQRQSGADASSGLNALNDSSLGDLGVLMLAEGVAALVSGPFWGKWSDRASNHVMAAAGACSAALMLMTVLLTLFSPQLLGLPALAGCLLFVAAVSHQGVRIGRKTYLVDIATSDNRAQYTAVSNTVIGLLVMLTGLFGLIDVYFGTVSVLVVLAVIAATGVFMSLRLSPAQ